MAHKSNHISHISHKDKAAIKRYLSWDYEKVVFHRNGEVSGVPILGKYRMLIGDVNMLRDNLLNMGRL